MEKSSGELINKIVTKVHYYTTSDVHSNMKNQQKNK